MIILGKRKRKKRNRSYRDTKISWKNGDHKYFIAVLYRQSLILKVKPTLLA